MSLTRDIAYALGLTVSAPVWGLSLLRTGKWRTDWAGRFGCAKAGKQESRKAGNEKRLLINAVSVGEVNLVRNLVALFEAEHPEVEIVIAVTTNTGFERATQLYGPPEGRHTVVRYPLDFTASVGRFLDAIQPDAVANVELEVWPNFVDACAARNIPICVINGRLSERSFRGYRKFRPLIGPSFAKLAFAAVQTETYAERFRYMGVKDVRIADTMKWDTAQVADTVPGAEQLAAELGIDRGKPLIVAGSTGPGEDALIINSLPPDVQLVIAPRKPEWFDDVVKVSPNITRRSTKKPGPGPLFLLDTIGELRMAYSLADVVIVGRSFLGLYGSDVMEPAALGKPVIVGPHHSDFQDTVDAMQAADGLIVAADPMPEAKRLLSNPTEAARIAQAGRDVILSRQGATKRHAEMLMELLKQKKGKHPV